MLRAGYGQSLTRKGERELVNYSEIENAFMFVSMSPQHENSAYLNTETGETEVG
jgi:hypothetical protein